MGEDSRGKDCGWNGSTVIIGAVDRLTLIRGTNYISGDYIISSRRIDPAAMPIERSTLARPVTVPVFIFLKGFKRVPRIQRKISPRRAASAGSS